MLDKLFGRGKKKTGPEAAPDTVFGRYSDNNKPLAKVNRWTDADNLFKEKKYSDSLDAFFEYLRDDSLQNVVYERNGAEGRFEFYQGSKIVRGNFNNELLKAEVTLARMPQPSVPVMRRLLEMNFNLYYSRFALDADRLCMRFDSEIETASPSKLYYGLKELATRADKQDDLLVQDFATLQTTDSEHLGEISAKEKEVKYEYLQKWIKQTLDAIAGVDADKFSGGIAYLLLSLIYKIDYLIAPEGKLLNNLEKIGGIYFKKDERPVVEKNRDMIEEFKKLAAISKEELFKYLFRSKYTFSIVAPQPYKTIADSIHGANQNMLWYRDNNHPLFASQISEYGISYCQYSYSLPRVITELYHLFIRVNYPEYFSALGYKIAYYDPKQNQFASQSIIDSIKEIQNRWKDKFPLLDFKTQNLKFDNLVNFNHTFTTELELLNTDSK
ncbi:MAG: hypothetical protein HZB42_11585 [Sphingobacteriales bacterium]|nr:hypothetical protein [Sphingobacteriales bacterium]